MNIQTVIPVFLLGSTIMVVFCRRVINSLIGLSLFSMFLALNFYILNAPDVAITEAALGVGLTTIVFLIAIRKTRRTEDHGSPHVIHQNESDSEH